MEEKTFSQGYHTFRTVFGTWYNSYFILLGKNIKNYSSVFRSLKFYLKDQSGITLVQVAIIIFVIGIASFLILSAYNPINEKKIKNDSIRKQHILTIKNVIEKYYLQFQRYPDSTKDFKLEGLDAKAVEWGSSWKPFGDVVPSDPDTNKRYVYFSTKDGQTYYLYASLDIEDDSSVCPNGTCVGAKREKDGPDLTKACGIENEIPCNYGITSSNVSP